MSYYREARNSRIGRTRDIRESLERHGAQDRPLDHFIYAAGHPIGIHDLIGDYCMLKSAISGVLVLNSNERMGDPDYDERIEVAKLMLQKHEEARVIKGRFLKKRLKFAKPRQVEIPKAKLNGELDELTIDMILRQGPVPTGKMRTLTIDQPAKRVICKSLQMLISAYMSSRWDPQVLCRPGVSLPHCLSTLRTAVNGSGRYRLLVGDFSGFFDRIPLSRALDAFRLMTGCNMDGRLAKLLKELLCFTSTGQRGVPQGNPLSPILANMFGAHFIDRKLKVFGPYMRYLDDFVLLLDDEDDAGAIYQQIEQLTRSHGMELHPEKTLLYDLRTGKGGPVSTPVSEHVEEPLVYLGAQVDLHDGDVRFTMHDQAVLRLAATIHDITAARSAAVPLDGTDKDGLNQFAQGINASRIAVEGWVQAYGGLQWTLEQQTAVDQILAHACLTQETFHQVLLRDYLHQDRFIDDPGIPMHSEAQYTQSELARHLYACCGLDESREIEYMYPRLHGLACRELLISRFHNILGRQFALDYGSGTSLRWTVKCASDREQLLDDGNVTNDFCDQQWMPTGEYDVSENKARDLVGGGLFIGTSRLTRMVLPGL